MKKNIYIGKISTQKMIELDQNIEILTTFGLNALEMEYLKLAIKMPTDEIKTFIEFYDKSIPKYDELKFINILMARYNENRDNIIKRINEVRRIIDYEKKLEESNVFFKKLEK